MNMSIETQSLKANGKVDRSSLFQSCEETLVPLSAKLTGHIPAWCQGTLIQIGPGKLDFDDFTVNYWLDGLGILTKFHIEGDTVTLSRKYIHTDAYLKALAKGKPAFTEFGTRPPGESGNLLSKLISTVSTLVKEEFSDNCIHALFPVGSDVFVSSGTRYFRQIDVSSLETGNKLDAKQLFGQNGTCARPVEDENGDIFNIGFTPLPSPKYNIIKIPHGFKTTWERFEQSLTICSIPSSYSGGFALNPSFGVTNNHVVFIEQPYLIKMSRVLASQVKGYTYKDWMEWCPQHKPKFYIIDKSTGKLLNEIQAADCFTFLEVVNCYEENDQITVDVTTAISPNGTECTIIKNLRKNVFAKIDGYKLQRFVIPLKRSQADNANGKDKGKKGSSNNHPVLATAENLTEIGIQSVSINRKFTGKKHTFVYISGSVFMEENPYENSICKVNTRTKTIIAQWQGQPTQFPGPQQPFFIPHPDVPHDEDNGVIVSSVATVNPNEKDFLLFLNAKDMTEIARVHFETRIPCAFNSYFVPSPI